ncbi:hypothetical protein ACFQZ2_16345, partial [Streptomonospora algeriensis]
MHYAPIPGGVYLGAHTHEFALRGSEALFKIADVCIPLLEDGAAEDDLVAALGSERARPGVRYLVEQLRRRGLILEPETLTVAEPSAEVRKDYAESLSRLEMLSDDPYSAFAALRNARIRLAGPAEAVRPAARGLTRAGAGRVESCS